MAFDYGTKRIGIAITDPLRMLAQPLDTVSSYDIFSFIGNYLLSDEIEGFVIGRSLNLKGEENPAEEHILGFCRGLSRLFPTIPQHRIDERFTSKIAKEAIVQTLPKEKRKDKALLDKVSAALILQAYLQTLDAR